jgi:hypothetical protein
MKDIEKKLQKLNIQELYDIFHMMNLNTNSKHMSNTKKIELISLILKPLKDVKQNDKKLSKTCQKSIRKISKSFTKKRIDKYFNKYVNKQNLEYSLSCAGKDRIKKEIEYIIIKNRIHEKEWKNEIESQIRKYLKK